MYMKDLKSIKLLLSFLRRGLSTYLPMTSFQHWGRGYKFDIWWRRIDKLFLKQNCKWYKTVQLCILPKGHPWDNECDNTDPRETHFISLDCKPMADIRCCFTAVCQGSPEKQNGEEVRRKMCMRGGCDLLSTICKIFILFSPLLYLLLWIVHLMSFSYILFPISSKWYKLSHIFSIFSLTTLFPWK